VRYLTVCEGGNVRSVTLAKILKELGEEAIAVGWKYTSPETFSLLVEWADRIVFVDLEENISKLYENLPAIEYRHKVRHLDVGEDNWGLAHHPDLVRILKERVNEIMLD